MQSRRPPVRRRERVEPTPETAAKLSDDPLRYWLERGDLTPDHERACYAIRRAVHALTLPVAVRAQNLERRDRASGEWTDAMSALIERYCDWADAMHRRRLSVCRALDSIMDDGYRWPRLDTLRAALDVWLRLGY